MSLRRRHGVQLAFINLTPLIDVCLMLVVFFVLCLTTSQAAPRALPVTLPEAASATAPVVATLEVVVQKDGALTIGGAPLSLLELGARAHGQARASILADRDCTHGRVVDVVDVLRRAGVVDVYFATAKPLQDW